MGDKISKKQGLNELLRFDESIKKLFEENQRRKDDKQVGEENIELISNPVKASNPQKEK